MTEEALKSIKRWIAIAALLLFVGQMFLYNQTNVYRERACQSVRDAFRIEHEELGRAGGVGAEDPRIVELDERVQARLKDCR